MFEGAQIWHSDGSRPLQQIGARIDSSPAAGEKFNIIVA